MALSSILILRAETAGDARGTCLQILYVCLHLTQRPSPHSGANKYTKPFSSPCGLREPTGVSLASSFFKSFGWLPSSLFASIINSTRGGPDIAQVVRNGAPHYKDPNNHRHCTRRAEAARAVYSEYTSTIPALPIHTGPTTATTPYCLYGNVRSGVLRASSATQRDEIAPLFVVKCCSILSLPLQYFY
ncbi:hypothetical protein ACJJTC_016890 [Scirpophaga incertulas]